VDLTVRRVFLAFLISLAFAQTAKAQPPIRWAKGTRILAWVDPAGAPPGAVALVDRAVATWAGAIGPSVTLRRSDSAADASIRVRFARSRGEYGETRPQVDPRTGTILKADVVITTDTGGDDPITQRIVLYLTALHELGHALGLRHTDDFSDIMYSFRRPDDGEMYFAAYRRRLRSPDDIGSSAASGLSLNDLAAAHKLYDQ
jgi:predicted Zn-dependent protease